MPAQPDAARCTGAGVRKPPGKEPAERLGAARAVLIYGDLGALDRGLDRRRRLSQRSGGDEPERGIIAVAELAER
jgi:hypothetical protein